MKTILLGVLILVGIQEILAATSLGTLHTEMVHGRPVTFCKYKSLRILPVPGESFTDYDSCTTCSCSGIGLECQTMPYITSLGESTCTAIKIGCEDVWVLKSDHTLDCPPNLIPHDVQSAGR